MRLVYKLKFLVAMSFVCMASMAHAANFELTPAIQAELDKWKTAISEWAADPIIVKAVAEQSSKGTIPEMDNAKWKITRRSDPIVKEFQTNPAGQFLKAKLEITGGAISEAFLSAAHGEKVAFVEKTTSYIHQGQAKFDVPFTTGKPWLGKAEFDESSQTYAIQLSVVVLVDAKPSGVLVVGVNLTALEKTAQK
jgi:hypothetical protein